MLNQRTQKLGIIGGTGKVGKGLAYRWAKTGYQVLIGSRLSTRAIETADELRSKFGPNVEIQGMDNEQVAQNCDVAILTIPYSVHQVTIEGLKGFLSGKLVIDATVPLVPLRKSIVQMPPAGSAAQEAFIILGQNALLATAFHNISYENLMIDAQEVECDVLVTGTSKVARELTLELVQNAGFNGWDAGSIENSSVVEGMTSILIGINRKYGSTHAGIRITGVKKVI